MAIKASGIRLVVAKSFARIFYRNAFNIGLPLLESEEAFDTFCQGMRVSVDLESGELVAVDTGKRVLARPVPAFMREMVEAGGLVAYYKKKGGTRPWTP
jgi:3-isopropylmalate/(R)-2-methylmalate dehydratase small subunit